MRLREGMGSVAALLSVGPLLLLAACPPGWSQPRHLRDPAFVEADAGSRRGDAEDVRALRVLARVAGFPAGVSPVEPASDAKVAAGAVHVVVTRNASGRDKTWEAAQIVLHRRRRAAFHAIAIALDAPEATRRGAALGLVHEAYLPCRTDVRGRRPCATWPEREELVSAVLKVATSDPDREVHDTAVGLFAGPFEKEPAPTTDAILAAIGDESDPAIRKSWFHALEARPPPSAPQGVALALRLAPEDVRVREFLGNYLVEANRALLEDAQRRGDDKFRAALGGAIFDSGKPLPWTETLVEAGLFDADGGVRACFTGAVTALHPVPDRVRTRLAATAATWESSRNALAFLRAKEEGRPLR